MVEDRPFILFPEKNIELGGKKREREREASVDFIDSKKRYIKMVLKSPFAAFLYIKKSMAILGFD